MAGQVTEEQQIEQIAEAVAKRVNSQLFLILGINTADPEELIALHRDLAHLRGWRESMEVVRKRGIATAASFLVAGVLGYLLLLFKGH